MNITATWQDNSNNEDGFRLEQSFNGGPFQLAATVGPNTQTVAVAVANPAPGGHTYQFRCIAFNSAGDSNDPPPTASITTPIVVPVPAGATNLQLTFS